MKIKDIIQVYGEAAPLELSLLAQKNTGAYDNSGLLISGDAEDTPCVVCALDLCEGAVNLAVEKGAKLIVTHHPVIYRAIKKIDGLYTKVIKNGITVFSSHLNLDAADGGIEDLLASVCGCMGNASVNEPIDGGAHGFGRIFDIPETSAGDLADRIVKTLCTKKYMFFGDKKKPVTTVGTFCGAGLNETALDVAENCDMYVSADMKHHIILSLLESGKCLLQLTHYASEVIPMKMFAEKLFGGNNIKYYFYFDERLM